MKLKPLQQWFCDTCGEIIQTPEHGWFEWVRDEHGRSYGFRICHHATHSPIRNEPRGPSCYAYDKARGRADLPLTSFIGSTGLAEMLSMLDVGELHDPDGSSLMRVKDIREWTFMCRRLFAPYFEEARTLFAAAKADGLYDDANEIWPYLEQNLKIVIERYGKD